MKKKSVFAVGGIVVLMLVLVVYTNLTEVKQSVAHTPKSSDQIYLYGEAHGVAKILEKEFELWSDYYHNEGMRHLFIEMPYYTGEFLNLWMKSDSNEILDEIYNDWVGTQSQTPEVKAFYEKIKKECPETIFHGTDIGHQYETTGKRFSNYLEANSLEESEAYKLTLEAIEQGQYYYGNKDDVYRENKMTENFIREFDKLADEKIMGIYGAAHTGLEKLDFTGTVPCMANQLGKHYGEIIYSEDLSGLAKEIEPSRVETLQIENKAYEASYFGKQDLNGFRGYVSREFWRLESAYEDFAEHAKTGDNLPQSNYPMVIKKGQVFIIDYTKIDGTIQRKYYRCDGEKWQSELSTVEFKLDK